jgi:adenylate kinase family enzyme
MDKVMPSFTLKLALLTAPSFAGKSTLSRRIEQELRLPILDCDKDVFCRGFRLLGKPELGQAIKPLGAWAYFRKGAAVDELYEILHRDWSLMAGSPRAVVAVGWIYCFREWRERVRRAFAVIPGSRVELKLFVLCLSPDDFFIRYVKAQRERFGNGYGFFDMTPEQQRKRSDDHFNEFFVRELELPSGDEMRCEQGPDDDLLSGIAGFCSRGASGA